MNLWQKAVEIGKAPVKISRAIKLSQELIQASISRFASIIPKNGLNSQLPRKPYTRRKPVTSKLQSESSDVPSAGDCEKVPDGGLVHDDEASGITFKTAIEQYKKKNKNNFSYFEKKTLRKRVAKIVEQTQVNKEVNYKGLFKNPKSYYNVERDFIVTKKNESTLNNHRFNDLQRDTAISSELIAYALHLFPPKYQTAFFEDKIFFD